MAGNAFAEARSSKPPEGTGQVAESIAPFLGKGCEPGRTLMDQGLGNKLLAIDLAPLVQVRRRCCPTALIQV